MNAKLCPSLLCREFTAKYSKYGVIVHGAGHFAQLHCLACNKAGLTTDGVIDHIISNTHEHNVSTIDWKYKLHLAGGFTRKEEVRATMQDRKQQKREGKKGIGVAGEKRERSEIDLEFRKKRERNIVQK